MVACRIININLFYTDEFIQIGELFFLNNYSDSNIYPFIYILFIYTSIT